MAINAEAFSEKICQKCMSFKEPAVPSFQWPGIGDIGLPNYTVGLYGASLAGVNYTLDFLPPDVDNLPEFPTLDIFIKGFTSSINFPYARPKIEIGAGFNIPAASGLKVSGYNIPQAGLPIGVNIPSVETPQISAALKMFKLFILFPFEVFKVIIQYIIDNVAVKIPGIAQIQSIFIQVAADIGINTPELPSLGNLSFCASKAVKELLDELLG